MRNKHITFIILTIFIMLSLVSVWPYIKMTLAGSAHYTEQNTREYNFYTPDILKNTPRISSQYEFIFNNITGPSSQIYAIRFFGTNDATLIDKWLASQGYKKMTQCHIEAVCWRGANTEELITVSILEQSESVVVSVIYNY